MRRFSFVHLSKLHSREFRITFPTIITLVRIFLVPCIVSAMLFGAWGVAYVFFIIASVSDMLDGAIARIFKQKTFLGACLDPLADKLLVVSCFATLACTDSLPFHVPFWFVGLVLFRELVLIIGFFYVFTSKEGVDVRPTYLGKVTAASQMLFIAWLFTCYFYGWAPEHLYYSVLLVIVGLIVISFFQYARIGWRLYYKNGSL